jgi:integrase/recombinase XerD
MAKVRVVKTSAPAPALVTLVDDYLAHCRARGLAPNTVNQAYRYPLLGVLLPFCEREGIADVARINARVLDRLSAQLLESGGQSGQPLSPHSVHSYSRAINHFLSWAKKEGEQVDAKAQLPKLPKRLVEVLSREEIQRMEHAARTERDKLIIRLLADTGLRVGELLGLRTNDLVEQNRNYYLHVRGKGAKDRLVPAPKVFRRLRVYIECGRPKDAVSNRVFLSHRRRPNGGDYEPLTTSGVDQLVRNVAESAGITKRAYPHLLRHSFATWQLSRGMNPIQLAQILGHSSLTMIQAVYSHLSPVDSYEAMLRTYREEEENT